MAKVLTTFKITHFSVHKDSFHCQIRNLQNKLFKVKKVFTPNFLAKTISKISFQRKVILDASDWAS